MTQERQRNIIGSCLALLLSACPLPERDTGGEGEGEGPNCASGRLVATSGASVDVDTCLDTLTLSDDGFELHFALEPTFSMRVRSEVALEPLPLTLDDANSSTFGSFDNGEHNWQISDGRILGVPVGEGETVLETRDDEGLHGTFNGTAFDNALGEELVDPLSLRIVF